MSHTDSDGFSEALSSIYANKEIAEEVARLESTEVEKSLLEFFDNLVLEEFGKVRDGTAVNTESFFTVLNAAASAQVVFERMCVRRKDAIYKYVLEKHGPKRIENGCHCHRCHCPEKKAGFWQRWKR